MLNLAFQNTLKGTQVCLQERITVGKATQPQILINFLPLAQTRVGTKGLIIFSYSRGKKRIVRIPFRTSEARNIITSATRTKVWISPPLHASPKDLLDTTGSVPRTCGIFRHSQKYLISLKIGRKHLTFQVKENVVLYHINILIFIPTQ